MGQKPWINYHHLQYFKVIALEGGIAKAAKKLRLGQPTLSTQMKQFEETLGQSLFDRTHRNIQLTEAGKLVLGYANEIFKLGDEMIDVLSDQHTTEKVRVQIGVNDTVAKSITLKMFQKAQKDHDCIATITEGHGDELLRELRAHRIDLVLSNYPPHAGDASGFYAKSISKMPVMICGAPKFASLKRDFPKSLEGQPFVLPTMQSKLRNDVDHYLKLAEIHINVVAEVQDTALQKLMGTHGHGLLPIALQAVDELIASKELVPIGKLDDVHEELWLIAAQRRIQNPVAAKLMSTFSLK